MMPGLGVTVLFAVSNMVGASAATPLPLTDSALTVWTSRSQSTQPPQQQPVQFDAARFDTLTARLLGELFDAAAARALPTKMLINKALEGSARRSPGARIVQVVNKHLIALADARDALGTTSSAAELDGGASALLAGIDSRTLALVRASRPNGSVETPLLVLTDIVMRGVPAATAREAVATLARLPKSDEALMGLQLTVAKNSVRGPGMALDALNRYVKGTVSGSAPSSTPATTDRKPIRPPTP